MRWLAALALFVFLGCGRAAPAGGTQVEGEPEPERVGSRPESFERAPERARMVESQVWARGISDQRVLAAMQAVPRHRFVPEDLQDLAYADRPLPIGHGVTISQPYIVALMSSLAELRAGERVLEIGTGSGYQAAVLAELGASVWSIERIEALADESRARLLELGYPVEVRFGDGWLGWPEHAPYDAIVTTAAPDEIPQTLLDQLAEGGRLVLPLGPAGGEQTMVVVEREGERFVRTEHGAVAFVPMLPGTTE